MNDHSVTLANIYKDLMKKTNLRVVILLKSQISRRIWPFLYPAIDAYVWRFQS